MKKFFQKFFVVSCLLLVSATPAMAALVPQCNPVGPKGDPNTCNLCHILELVKNLITFALEIGIAMAGLFIAWGAFVIMTAGGSEEKVSRGKEMMTTVVWGLLIAFSSWIILGTIIQILTGSPSSLPWTEIKCTF